MVNVLVCVLGFVALQVLLFATLAGVTVYRTYKKQGIGSFSCVLLQATYFRRGNWSLQCGSLSLARNTYDPSLPGPPEVSSDFEPAYAGEHGSLYAEQDENVLDAEFEVKAA